MRKAEFNVPSELMVEFVDELTSLNLNNTITGTNEDEEIIIEVDYEKEESKDIDALEKFLDELIEKWQEENEEEEEEEED